MQGYCAQFKLGEDFFYFQNKEGKAGRKLSLPEGIHINKLAAFFDDKENKIKKASDALFIIKALEGWNVKKTTLVADKAAKDIFTGEDLQAVEYEKEFPSGLKMHILHKGDGPMAKQGQAVSVHYRGYLLKGKIFDESYKRGQPFAFPLGAGRVIKGWDEALSNLNVGTRALIYLPPDLAYGNRGAGADIPPGATLVFDVLFMGIN
jgi:FKBP-type peptidyl-prolyl cis-trans isomerase